MKRPTQPHRPPRALASRRRAQPGVVAAPAVEQAGVDQAGPIDPIDDPRGAQASIERVDERRIGSIEAVPAVPEVITGFVEAAGDERADVP